MVAEKKRIVIPGGAGYIGSHVVLSILQTGRYRVTVLDNYHNSFPESIKRIEQIVLSELPANASQQDKDDCKIDLFKADLINKAEIDAVFAHYEGKGGVWGVVHVAAHKAVGESGEVPLQYYANNITGTINLLEVMHKYKATNLVYSSSATVYGVPKTIPIPELTPMAPESVYGRTKMMAELMIKDVCDAYVDSWRAISLRYFNPAGAHSSGLIGEDPRGKPGNLLPLLAQMAVGKYRDPGLQVFGNDYPTPDGTCVRDYLHVMDLAYGHVLALDNLLDDSKFAGTPSPGKYKAYNLGRGVGMSVLQMIEAMKKVTGYGYPYEVVGRRLGDVPDLTADPSLAEKELGFKATRSLDDMSRDLWNWQSKNPNGYDQQ